MKLISGKQSEIENLNGRVNEMVADHGSEMAQLNANFENTLEEAETTHD